MFLAIYVGFIYWLFYFQGLNLEALKEAILAEAEMLNLNADYDGFVEGTVLEAKTDPGRGWERGKGEKREQILMALWK